jgi:hypothetical protein
MKFVRVRHISCSVCRLNRDKPVDMVDVRNEIDDGLVVRLCRQCLKHAASMLKRSTKK